MSLALVGGEKSCVFSQCGVAIGKGAQIVKDAGRLPELELKVFNRQGSED